MVGPPIAVPERGTSTVNKGSLCPALYRLEDRGWIDSEEGTSPEGRAVRFSHLTRAGRAQFAQGPSEVWLGCRTRRAFRACLKSAFDPVHPGLIVRDDCVEPLGLTVTNAAGVLGVSRQALNNVVNARAAISPEMAVRLAKAFGSSAETWLRMQMAYDLAEVSRREDQIKVKRYVRKRSPAA